MTEISHLPPEDRRELFRRTTATGAGPGDAMMVEKDYWVCWMLGKLFGDAPGDEIAPGLVFKGGTSLSKVYNAIRRFSEDIDLTIPRPTIGIQPHEDLEPDLSVSQRQKRLAAMDDRCAEYVGSTVRSTLIAQVAEDLRGATRREPWTIEIDPTEASTLLFTYPAALESGEYGVDGYVRPSIRLEFGVRNDPTPAHDASVEPYVVAVSPNTIQARSSCVRVLDGRRTFWEKATILHLEAHRTHRRHQLNRLSRHYSDLAVLADHRIGAEALENFEMLRTVALHKAAYFRTPWARYEDAAEGRVRLLPPADARAALKVDYGRMSEMFFEAPLLQFEEVLERLESLEAAIRSL